MERILFWSRVIGASAIGLSGLLSALGLQDWAAITMIIGTAAAAPSRNEG